MQSTVSAVERELAHGALVYRYHGGDDNEGLDGITGRDAAFVACGFWLVVNYALAGRVDEARRNFEQLLSLSSPLGLLAEEYDPDLERQLGNFPLAISHVPLILAARALEHPDQLPVPA